MPLIRKPLLLALACLACIASSAQAWPPAASSLDWSWGRGKSIVTSATRREQPSSSDTTSLAGPSRETPLTPLDPLLEARKAKERQARKAFKAQRPFRPRSTDLKLPAEYRAIVAKVENMWRPELPWKDFRFSHLDKLKAMPEEEFHEAIRKRMLDVCSAQKEWSQQKKAEVRSDIYLVHGEQRRKLQGSKHPWWKGDAPVVMAERTKKRLEAISDPTLRALATDKHLRYQKKHRESRRRRQERVRRMAAGFEEEPASGAAA